MSQPTVGRILLEFVRSGLVLQVPGGYVVNREHLAYRAIESLLDTLGELRRRVAATVATWEVPAVSVVQFGSTARGQAGPSSDVDLLVVHPIDVDVEDLSWARNVAALGEQVTACAVKLLP